jgi:hypothetical protein
MPSLWRICVSGLLGGAPEGAWDKSGTEGCVNYQTIFTNRRTVRDLTEQKRNELPSGGHSYTWEKVGEEEVVYNVAVDIDQLAQMGRLAARNKSQKCKDGALLVEVVTRKRRVA